MKTLVAFLVLLMTSSNLPAQEQQRTPKELGYTFPDEWEAHEGTMMIFPAFESYPKQGKKLRKEFRTIAQAIAAHEAVLVFCRSEEEEECDDWLGDIANLTIKAGPFRIDWARDNAPMVLVNEEGKKAVAGFRFNGWGKKYEGWQEDVDTRDDIAKAMGWPIFHSEFVLEGGSIEIGGGIGIVTESCVLNRNRTNWSKEKVETELKNLLGLDKIIWLKSGLMPDPITDGHVDGLCKFVADKTVLLHSCDRETDINYAICRDAKKELESHGLKVIDLPLMDDIVHMNYYIGSNGEIAYVPICGDPHQDDPALKVIRKIHPKVIPIKGLAMAKAGGGIHCYTQQIPASK